MQLSLIIIHLIIKKIGQTAFCQTGYNRICRKHLGHVLHLPHLRFGNRIYSIPNYEYKFALLKLITEIIPCIGFSAYPPHYSNSCI